MKSARLDLRLDRARHAMRVIVPRVDLQTIQHDRGGQRTAYPTQRLIRSGHTDSNGRRQRECVELGSARGHPVRFGLMECSGVERC